MDLLIAAAKGTGKMAHARHNQEIGLLIAGIGAIAVIVAGILGILEYSRPVERGTTIAGGLLLGVGFLIELLALHSI